MFQGGYRPPWEFLTACRYFNIIIAIAKLWVIFILPWVEFYPEDALVYNTIIIYNIIWVPTRGGPNHGSRLTFKMKKIFTNIMIGINEDKIIPHVFNLL